MKKAKKIKNIQIFRMTGYITTDYDKIHYCTILLLSKEMSNIISTIFLEKLSP